VSGVRININLKGSLDDAKINEILDTIRRLDKMAVDQATFDSALTEFFTDLDTGLEAIAARLAALEVPVDLTAELQQVTDAKSKFDAAVLADTTPPAAP
jgi:hypothetical protein